MAFHGGNNNLAYSLNSPFQNVTPPPIMANRAPISTDVAPIGQLWIYSGDVYIYIGTGGWLQLQTV